MASSQVVAGEKFRVPLRMVPSHDEGGICLLTSKARLFSPGRMPASCRSWTPYARTPAATTIRMAPVHVKNFDRLIFSTPL